LVGFYPAAAVDRASRVGVFQVARIMRPRRILILERIAEVLVERRVPRPLNQATARRVVMRGRQREPRAGADAIYRLHERLAERCLADDVGTVVILKGAGDDLRGARAVATREHHDWHVRELAVL